MKSRHGCKALPKLLLLVVATWAVVVRESLACAEQAEFAAASPSLSDAAPPELEHAIEPDYSSEALAARIEGSVVLRLSIDDAGNVTEAEVIEPLGYGLDEAARAAALRARFRPARRGELKVASRVRVRVPFKLPLAAPSAVVPAPLAGPETQVRSEKPSAGVTMSPTDGPEQPLEVTVHGPSEAEQRRQSAEAVTVVETDEARRRSADLGEVLARTRGVGVRRAGGLGSSTRFSLNGLTDDQVRFFLDGVPLELAGYPFGIANVPVNLVERVEIYSGVVPVRFGADALGGAVALVSDDDLQGRRLAASYEMGSFDSYRLTVAGRALHEPNGLFVRGNAFVDYSRNNYPIDVQVPDERGRPSEVRVYRFHDAYRAAGGNAEVGFVERHWAKRLLLRGFATSYDKQYQHNIVMTVPYGGVTYGETVVGSSLRYEQAFRGAVTVNAVAGYAYTRGTFRDVATCVYDWFGRCLRQRTQAGETGVRPYDQVYWGHSAFARINAGWRVRPAHAFRLSISPTYLTRTGDERRQNDPSARDPLSADRRLLTLVSGLEYELNLLGERLENIAFAKQYVQLLKSEEPRPGSAFRRRDRDTHRLGVGDGARFRLLSWLYAKASYEWATRLPRPDEVFGDNAFIVANLGLGPETSHNLNLGLALDARGTRAGSFRATVNGFLREAKDLIVLLGSDRVQSYQNVYNARSRGFEGSIGWTAPGEYLVLDGNATYVDLRNASHQGTFADFRGDRVPNRPYLFANGSARVQLRGLFAARDQLSLDWTTRYVQRYFRGWESVGLVEFKQVIPAQVVHGAGLGYLVHVEQRSLGTSLEVENLGDAAVFDFFGAQRPGRAFYAKVTVEL